MIKLMKTFQNKFLNLVIRLKNPNSKINGRIIFNKGKAYISLEKNSLMDLHESLEINYGYNNHNGKITAISLQKRAKLNVNGNFIIYGGADIIIFENAVLDLGNSYANINLKIRCKECISIGAGCAIGQDVLIMDSDSHIILYDGYIRTKKVIIKDNVWIGARSTILKGVTIGEGAVVAAGSVVAKDIPPYSLAGGVPAVVIKQNIHWKQ